MRLLTLDLIAWGPFTDRSHDLSGGRQGLHLIYGPNEAGKSSALRALRALLYGVDARAKDAFLHEYKDLRVRSRLRHSDGREIDVTRRKGSKKTLLGSGDTALLDITRCLLSAACAKLSSPGSSG